MTIPASNIVTVNPGVLNPGGNPLSLNMLFETENLLMPTNSVLGFSSTAAVSAFFGPSSAEAALAPFYFNGYDNDTSSPSSMLFSAFNLAARAATLTSGSLAGVSLAQLQGFGSGTLTLTINGTSETSSTIALGAIGSFSAAAAAIQAAFTGTVPVVTWNAVNSTFLFTSPTTGSSSTITFATTDALATDLMLTSATGAVISPGAALDTPATAMSRAASLSQNWVTFTTLFEPTLADKLNFTAWSNSQNNRYAYIGWDTDAQAIVNGATEPFGVVIKGLESNGVMAISGNAADVPVGSTLAGVLLQIAAFVGGAVASFDFSQTNGARSLAFLTQAGLTPSCTDAASSVNLLANGYSFYGSYATANQGFNFFYNSQMPGVFGFLNKLVQNIQLNAAFQLSLMTLLSEVSISYDQYGYSFIRSAMQDDINAALNYGTIRTGVALSQLQINELNAAAGLAVDSVVTNLGYYLQVKDPGATVRAAGGTPVINFWYTDGGDVLLISLNSIDIL